MAKQPTIFVKGSIGNVIFYERNGKHFARSKPGSVQQTTNMKQRSLNFGVAARAGKTLRMQLASLLPFPKDRKNAKPLFRRPVAMVRHTTHQ